MQSGRGNLELAHAVVRALNEGGPEAIVPFYSEEVEWYMPEAWLEQDVYRGRDGIREIASVWFGQFDDYRWDEVEVTEVDPERILGLYMMRGRSKENAIPVEQPVGLIATYKDGLIVRGDAYFSWNEARAAAGVGSEA